jgi:hypothetical protein
MAQAPQAERPPTQTVTFPSGGGPLPALKADRKGLGRYGMNRVEFPKRYPLSKW